MPQQGFGQQRAALPNKLRRYARMHTCNPWPVLEHMAQMHASRLTIFICWAFSSAQVPSEMIILTVPRRESFWFSLCQRENLLEAKPVDVRLRRKEGREGKSFSDLVRRKQRLVTATENSFLFPDYAATVLFVVLGRALRLHVTSKPHKRQRENACHELDEGCLGWCATRGQRRNDDAQRPSQPADWRSTCTTRHEHSFWARASRIRYGHIQTKLTFICGFSLNPPPPPLGYVPADLPANA